MKATPLIHVGVGKTGTTTLQNNLFSRHSGILNVGRPYANEEFKQAIESLRDDDASDYKSSTIFRLLERAIASSNDRALVLSDETLVHPVHQSLVADRLHASLPQAQVLITIRNQFDLVASYWAAHGMNLKGVPSPYRGKKVSFDNWFAFEADARRGFFVRLNFERLHRIYSERFGVDRVHILTFEGLARDPLNFACTLSALVGVDQKEMSHLIVAPAAKTRPSGARVNYSALRGRLLPNFAFSKLPGGPAIRRALYKSFERDARLKVTLTPSQREFLADRFGAGNQTLATRLCLDLKSLGYPWPKDPVASPHPKLEPHKVGSVRSNLAS